MRLLCVWRGREERGGAKDRVPGRRGLLRCGPPLGFLEMCLLRSKSGSWSGDERCCSISETGTITFLGAGPLKALLGGLPGGGISEDQHTALKLGCDSDAVRVGPAAVQSEALRRHPRDPESLGFLRWSRGWYSPLQPCGEPLLYGNMDVCVKNKDGHGFQ